MPRCGALSLVVGSLPHLAILSRLFCRPPQPKRPKSRKRRREEREERGGKFNCLSQLERTPKNRQDSGEVENRKEKAKKESGRGARNVSLGQGQDGNGIKANSVSEHFLTRAEEDIGRLLLQVQPLPPSGRETTHEPPQSWRTRSGGWSQTMW